MAGSVPAVCLETSGNGECEIEVISGPAVVVVVLVSRRNGEVETELISGPVVVVLVSRRNGDVICGLALVVVVGVFLVSSLN